MSIDDIVTELLLRWEENRSRTPEELCQEHGNSPQYVQVLEAVQQGIRDLQAAAALLDTAKEGANGSPGAAASAPHDAVAAGGGGRSQSSAAPPTWTAPGVRYRPVAFHARGGLGEVFRADDGELHREVALKRIQERHRGNAESRRRFLREAEITARLQHPGIVPVYGLGQDADGQACYAMRFVEGGTLDDALKRFHEADRKPGRDPGERSLALRELLTRFIAGCNTVAYAHSKGILHRDLKPGNIMLGDYGETLVVDWGLAKPFGRLKDLLERGADLEKLRDWGLAKPFPRTEAERSPEEETRMPAPDRPPEGGTHLGEALGTPAYMSPEQAEGRWDEVGPASDIFSLGATLYALLSGQAPFRGRNNDDVLHKARRGDFLPPRRVKRDIPRALEAICLKAMTFQPEQRYGTAKELASDVGQWLADEPVSAYREPMSGRARRWARRHKPLVAAATAVLLATLALGGGGAWWVQQRRAATDAAAAGLMEEARLLLDQARRSPLADAGKYGEALKTARKARRLADDGGASAGVRQDAAKLVQELENEADAGNRDRRLLAALLEVRGPREGPKFQEDDKGLVVELAEPSADEQFQAAFRVWDPAFDVDVLPTDEVAARLKGRPAAVVTEVIAALDEWASERRRQEKPSAEWQPVAALAAALDDGPGARRAELRALLARGNLQRARALGALGAALRPVPVPFDAGLGEDRGRLRVLAAQVDTATEPVLGLLTLARALRVAGDDVLAEGLLRSALWARPQEVVLHAALAGVLESQRPPRWKEAVECYAAMRALRPELGQALANGLVNCGRADEGLALYARLMTERAHDPWLRANFGMALAKQGRNTEAAAAFRDAIALRRDFPEAHNQLGNVLIGQGDYKAAAAAFRDAIALRRDFPEAHNNLGSALHRQGSYEEAKAAYRAAICQRPNYALAYHNLGNVLSDQGAYKAAVAAYNEAIRFKPDFLAAHNNLGRAFHYQDCYKEAEQAYRETLRIKRDLPESHNNLGNALGSQDRYKEAEEAYREAIHLRPNYLEAYNGLGHALRSQGRYKEEEEACQKIIDLNPDYPDAYYKLGNALRRQGRYKEAEEAYRQALRRQPDHPEVLCNLGHVLREQGRFTEALEKLRRGNALGRKVLGRGWGYPSADWVRQCERCVELDRQLPAILRGDAEPASVAERVQFAYVCRYKRLCADAARIYTDAFTADPRLAVNLLDQHRYNAARSAALAAAEQVENAKLLPDKVVLMLRGQALSWLRDDLTLYGKMAERGADARQAVRKNLQSWQQAAQLSPVRDEEALGKLPNDERWEWRRLWEDVAALLKKVEAKK